MDAWTTMNPPRFLVVTIVTIAFIQTLTGDALHTTIIHRVQADMILASIIVGRNVLTFNKKICEKNMFDCCILGTQLTGR